MISCLARLRGNAGQAASRRVAFEPWQCLGTWPGSAGPATLRLGWSQRTDVRHILVLPRSSADLGRVPGVAAFRRPRLVTVLAMVPQPRLHPHSERGQAVAVPSSKASLVNAWPARRVDQPVPRSHAPGVDAAANTLEWRRRPPSWRRCRRRTPGKELSGCPAAAAAVTTATDERWSLLKVCL